jgi:hypothetical protein
MTACGILSGPWQSNKNTEPIRIASPLALASYMGMYTMTRSPFCTPMDASTPAHSATSSLSPRYVKRSLRPVTGLSHNSAGFPPPKRVSREKEAGE